MCILLVFCARAQSRLGAAEELPAPLRPLDQAALRRVGTELHARLVRVSVRVRIIGLGLGLGLGLELGLGLGLGLGLRLGFGFGFG